MDIKTEMNLISGLNKLFNLSASATTEDPKIFDNKMLASECNIYGLIPKKEFIGILSRYVISEHLGPIIKNLDYVNREQNLTTENCSKYDTKILSKIITLCAKIGLSVNLSLKSDYPLKIETEYFIMYLAPKVCQDKYQFNE